MLKKSILIVMLSTSVFSFEGILMSIITKTMLPELKKELLVEEKVLTTGRKCFAKAKNLVEANNCNRKLEKINNEEFEDFDVWDNTTRDKLFKFIDHNLKVIDCIKKSKNATQADACGDLEDDVDL